MEQEYLDITYLPENGFERKRCPECGKYYWTAGGHELCNDPPCGSYTFIGNPLFNQKFNLTEMREKFLSFFEKRGHPRIERYPVVARWRDDIYLTIASIADFQPFVTSGVVPPPANPLTISQPCIRMDDLDSVGRTGRHLTIFEMMAHHTFNSSQREIYWKNKTVALCTELLNELGVPTKDIIYKEEPWAGGGNAGPCLEAIVGGLELSTLVFMNMIADPQGDIEIKGEKYRKMDNYIVDTGYGLERFVWASQGTPTVYDAIFPQVLEQILANSNIEFNVNDEKVKQIIGESSKIAGVMGELRGKALQNLRHNVASKLEFEFKEIEEVVLPLEKVYALADHTRTILFMLGDGLIPSNAGGGYLARLMIRRALRLAEELEFDGKLYDLVDTHRKICGMDFETPETTIQEILDLEQDRYTSTVIKGTSMIKRTLSKKKKIEKEDFIEFYDSHGIPAEVAMKIAEEKGVEVEYPEDFYSELASKHVQANEDKGKEVRIGIEGTYPPTEKLYYDSSVLEFNASVVGRENGKLFLDKTAFYPESGGQDNDTGYLIFDGKEVPVVDVVEENGVVVHRIKKGDEVEVGEGTQVKGVVDKQRRLRHMRHHSATHILLYALQQVLGKHVWQSGARKEWGRARLDITHYQQPDKEKIRKIEYLANKEVMANKPVSWDWMDRLKAEEEYGFRLYQGGVPAGEKIRVMRVGDDVQACGGTHVHYTGDIGVIKILRVDSIQDGVIRFEYAAGEAALEHIAHEEDLLRDASGILRVEPSQLPKTASRFFEEWKDQKKEIERLTEEIATSKSQLLAEEAETHNSVKVVAQVFEDAEMQELVKVGRKLAEQNFVGVLATRNGVKVVTFSGLKEVDSRDMIKEVGRHIKGSGGGKPDLAQGAGQAPPTRDQLVDIIFRFLGQQKRSS